jgi:tRNA-specific adenosine deaminase 1
MERWPDDLTSSVLTVYRSLNFKPPSGQFTILASFVLTSPATLTPKIISLSTGSKCLPAIRLPPRGDALHDSHAEVLARRGAVRWFLEELGRFIVIGKSEWISLSTDGKYGLRDGVRICLYISTIPCKNRFFHLSHSPELDFANRW